MGRLIDADALIEEIWKKHKETEEGLGLFVDELKDVFCGVVATIDEQPTAYNVDAVVAELEEKQIQAEKDMQLSDDIEDRNGYGGMSQAYERAIEIVKKGGVEHE